MSTQYNLFGEPYNYDKEEPKDKPPTQNFDHLPIITSVSGGQSSAYIAANYPSDSLVFALIRTSDMNCQYKDRTIAKRVEDKLQAPFIGTLEDDTIIQTMFELEQYTGKEIHWVTGPTFDELIEKKGGNYLPNRMSRFCTQIMKVEPTFYWSWEKHGGHPVLMNIGYRSEKREIKRANTMLSKHAQDGYQYFEASFGLHQEGRHKGKKKWDPVKWRRASFPMIRDGIDKQDVKDFWRGKPVKFARMNNCVGCFHRSASLLRMMAQLHPKKMQWFADQESVKKVNGITSFRTWKAGMQYSKILQQELLSDLLLDDIEAEGCTSGWCGV